MTLRVSAASETENTQAERVQNVLDGYCSAQPFIKWVGGKRKLIPAILAHAPQRFERYLEPFLGGGSLALALGLKGMLLNDANAELINAYAVVGDSLVRLTEQLEHLKRQHSEEFYYAVRATNPDSLTDIEQAARFIYLNKTGFNGLYRVNRFGQFNVPFGHHANPGLYDVSILKAAADVITGSQLFSMQYDDFLRQHARAGDFIYLDPPYIPVSLYSDFKRYTAQQFRENDQVQLAALYTDLVELGAYPLLSNSYTPLSLELYGQHRIVQIEARRNVNSNGMGRGSIAEILVMPRLKRGV